MIAVQV